MPVAVQCVQSLKEPASEYPRVAGYGLAHLHIPLHPARLSHEGAVSGFLKRHIHHAGNLVFAVETSDLPPVFYLHYQRAAGGPQGRDGVEGMELSAAVSVLVRKNSRLHHQIGRAHAPFPEIGVLAQNGLICAQSGIDKKKLHKKSTGLTGLGLCAGKRMPPAHISFFCQKAPRYIRISL